MIPVERDPKLDVHCHLHHLIETASDYLPRIYLVSNLGGNVQTVHHLTEHVAQFFLGSISK